MMEVALRPLTPGFCLFLESCDVTESLARAWLQSNTRPETNEMAANALQGLCGWVSPKVGGHSGEPDEPDSARPQSTVSGPGSELNSMSLSRGAYLRLDASFI